jgi:hypothetical protein
MKVDFPLRKGVSLDGKHDVDGRKKGASVLIIAKSGVPSICLRHPAFGRELQAATMVNCGVLHSTNVWGLVTVQMICTVTTVSTVVVILQRPLLSYSQSLQS